MEYEKKEEALMSNIYFLKGKRREKAGGENE